MPRLSLLDDEDDGLTCRLCLQPFWYKAQLIDHLKETHSIADPIKVRVYKLNTSHFSGDKRVVDLPKFYWFCL